jgi:hypothetical protein
MLSVYFVSPASNQSGSPTHPPLLPPVRRRRKHRTACSRGSSSLSAASGNWSAARTNAHVMRRARYYPAVALFSGLLAPCHRSGCGFVPGISCGQLLGCSRYHHCVDIPELARTVKASNAIALLGAGSSYDAGVPLARELPPLLWAVLDRNPEVRASCASAVGIPDARGKTLVARDPKKVKQAFEFVAASSKARSCFQALFVKLNDDRIGARSRAHESIARLVHTRSIELVISLNWDSLLEVAYSRIFGPSINQPRQVLFKPHGDVLAPSQQWTLPGENTVMPGDLLRRLEAGLPPGFIPERMLVPTCFPVPVPPAVA